VGEFDVGGGHCLVRGGNGDRSWIRNHLVKKSQFLGFNVDGNMEIRSNE
jgi:hypothetical protein